MLLTVHQAFKSRTESYMACRERVHGLFFGNDALVAIGLLRTKRVRVQSWRELASMAVALIKAPSLAHACREDVRKAGDEAAELC